MYSKHRVGTAPNWLLGLRSRAGFCSPKIEAHSLVLDYFEINLLMLERGSEGLLMCRDGIVLDGLE